MADLDLTELLSDPDFVSALGRVRRSLEVTGAGVATVTEAPAVTVYGSVQPAGPDDLAVLPEGTRLSDTIAVYSLTRLTPVSAEGAGDVLVWKGRRWLVSARPEDFGHFGGGGYVKVLAVVESPAPVSPHA